MSEETVAMLNELLEAERAGAEALAWLSHQEPKGYVLNALEKIAKDEGWSCYGLSQAILRYQGAPSTKTGEFAQKLMVLGDPIARLDLLARGQSWVVKRLDKLLNTELDGESRRFIIEMRQNHQDNIRWCQERVAELNPKS